MSKTRHIGYLGLPRGAIEAARLLNIPVSRIARTNKPLESFNGRIKGKYYKPYQHSGRLPRIDMWILLLVTAVMPDFFKEQKNKKDLQNFYASKRVIGSILPPSHDPLQDLHSESDAFSFSGTSESNASQLYDDNLIQRWLEELNNPTDEDESPHLDSNLDSPYIPPQFNLILR